MRPNDHPCESSKEPLVICCSAPSISDLHQGVCLHRQQRLVKPVSSTRIARGTYISECRRRFMRGREHQAQSCYLSCPGRQTWFHPHCSFSQRSHAAHWPPPSILDVVRSFGASWTEGALAVRVSCTETSSKPFGHCLDSQSLDADGELEFLLRVFHNDADQDAQVWSQLSVLALKFTLNQSSGIWYRTIRELSELPLFA